MKKNMNIAKRILSSPSMLLNFITGKDSEEEVLEKEKRINKPSE